MRLREKLKEQGFNRDVEVEEELWRKHQEELHPTRLSLADFKGKNAASYRDERRRESLHLKDYTEIDSDYKDYIAELERFNPEHHPILHLLIDFPLWLWRNRLGKIINRGTG